MRTIILSAVSALLFFVAPSDGLSAPILTAAGVNASSQAVSEAGDEIVVVGKRTGPRLWRVTKGASAESEIFVLVSVETVPEDLEWETSGIAALLEDTEEILLSPSAGLGAGNATRMIGAMVRTLVFNPGRIKMKKGVTLADKVGPDLAAAFDRARARVDARKAIRKEKKKNDDALEGDFDGLDEASKSRIEKRLADLKPERLHPYLQAGSLQSDAIDSAGLASFSRIEKQIARLGRKAKVKSRPISEIDVAFTDIKQVLKSIRNFSDETNRLCIAEAVEFADNELEIEAARADAWARGDVQFLRDTAKPERLSPCSKALSGELPGLKTFGGATLEDIDTVALWTDEMLVLLDKPGIRLTVIPDNVWLRPGGAMDRLIENGASVRAPDDGV